MFLAVSAPRALHHRRGSGDVRLRSCPRAELFRWCISRCIRRSALKGCITCGEGDPRRIYRPAHRYVRSALASISTSAM
jgi:hypothetical protein